MVLGLVSLLLLVGAIYSPGLRNTFIGWDDYPYIRDNALLRSADGLGRIWTTREAPQYYPLTFTSYWIQYQLWGARPTAYFLGNVLLHALNVLLLGVLLRALGANRWTTWLACALFAVHPIQVAAVAWAAERKTLLAAFFFLVSFILFVRHRETGSMRTYWLMLLAYLMAILSKTVAVTLIGSLLLAELWIFRRRDWGLLWRLLPLAVLALGPLLVVAEREQALRVSTADTPLLLRPLFAAAALWTYVLKILAPARLLSIYPEWRVSAGQLVWWLALLAALGAAWACWRWRRRIDRLAGWGLGHFVVSLLPAIGILRFGFLDYSPIGDHLVYFAMMGGMLALAVAIQRLAGSGGRRSRGIAVSVAVAAALLALSAKTWSQVHVWRDPDTFWLYNLEYNPTAQVAHLNMGAELAERGDYAAARPHLEYVVSRTPWNYLAQTNLAGVLLNLGYAEESLQRAQTAVQLRPSHALAHIYHGAALARVGKPNEALEAYQIALSLEPNNGQAFGWMAEALQQLGRLDEAEQAIRAMARVDPREARAHLLRANLELQRGNPEAAVAACHAALRLNPDNGAAHLALAVALGAQGDVAGAAAALRRTLAIDPRSLSANAQLAWILASASDAGLRNAEEAIQLAQRARAAAGDESPSLLDILAAGYAAAGRFPEAIETAQQAVELARRSGSLTRPEPIEMRLALYRQGRPFVMAPAAGSPGR